jgi:hypothetical protein
MNLFNYVPLLSYPRKTKKGPKLFKRVLFFIFFKVVVAAETVLTRVEKIQSVSSGAFTGHALTHILHSVQVSLSISTLSSIMLMAITGQRSMQPPQPVHLS